MNCFKIAPRFATCFLTIVLLLCGLSSPVMAASKILILATTTSTQDTGLLDILIPLFEKESGYFVKTIAVGSGHAMVMGQRGEADALLVHSPAEEVKFMVDGFGSQRRLVMHNDFVVIGPDTDPAKLRNSKTSAEAFRKIATSQSLFLSRNDNSGTHAKEKELWKTAGITPDQQKWYQQTGLGMAHTLLVANEKKGYTLSDRATYLSLKKHLKLAVILEYDTKLLNIYHVIEVNAAKWPKVNSVAAKAFADFLAAPKTQKEIGRFGVAKFGESLFFPDAGKKPEELGLSPVAVK